MKTIRSILFFVLILGTTANSQVVTPIPVPTIIKTAPYTISTPGYYQLGADLTVTNTSGNIITISTSNVTLDFAGHYISGPSSSNAIATGTLIGVYASEEGNLTIRNGTIAFCEYGIYLSGNNTSSSLNINQRIDNMLVSYCSYYGVALQYTNNSAVTNCRVSFTGGDTTNGGATGVAFIGGLGNMVSGCTVTNTAASSYAAYGIYTTGSSTVQNNTVTSVTTAGSGVGAAGIDGATFAIGNTVSNAQYGLYYCTKYANNLTSGCTTPFTSGTEVGYNN